MEVKFQTKSESKKRQKEDFLKLSGSKRILRFLELSRTINSTIPVKNKLTFEESNKGNFLMIHPDLKEE